MSRADPKPLPPRPVPRPRPEPHPVDPRRPRPGRLPIAAALILGVSLILTPFVAWAWTAQWLTVALLVAALPLYAAASLLFSPAVLRRLEVPAFEPAGVQRPARQIRNRTRDAAGGVPSPVLTPAATYSQPGADGLGKSLASFSPPTAQGVKRPGYVPQRVWDTAAGALAVPAGDAPAATA